MNVSHKFLWITFGRMNVFYPHFTTYRYIFFSVEWTFSTITSRFQHSFISVEWAFSTTNRTYLQVCMSLPGISVFHRHQTVYTTKSRVSRWNERVPQTPLDSIILHVYTIQLPIAIIHWYFHHEIVALDPSHKHSKIHIHISASQTNIHNSNCFQRTSVGNLEFLMHAL